MRYMLRFMWNATRGHRLTRFSEPRRGNAPAADALDGRDEALAQPLLVLHDEHDPPGNANTQPGEALGFPEHSEHIEDAGGGCASRQGGAQRLCHAAELGALFLRECP